jgi:hypothetical protein
MNQGERGYAVLAGGSDAATARRVAQRIATALVPEG